MLVCLFIVFAARSLACLLCFVLEVLGGGAFCFASPACDTHLSLSFLFARALPLLSAGKNKQGPGVLALHEGHPRSPSEPTPPQGQATPLSHQQNIRLARVLPTLAGEARWRF